MTNLDLNKKFAACAAKESKSLLEKIERANAQLGRMLVELKENQRQSQCKHDWYLRKACADRTVHRCLKCDASVLQKVKK